MDGQEQAAQAQTKQLTIDVPEDRVAEFYAFFGRFLAGRHGRRGRGRGSRHRHGGCGRRGRETGEQVERAVSEI
jgi:hypothetical protein